MIVVVGGMYRSGSTFSFNVVRELLARDGPVMTRASDSLLPCPPENGAKHLILKSHAPDALCDDMIRLGAVRCVCTYRRPEDAVASWMHSFGHDLAATIELMRAWLAWHARAARHCLNIGYDDIDRRPLRVILAIQRWLVGGVRPIAALRLRRTYDKRKLMDTYARLERSAAVRDIGFSYYDPTTFFHRRHVSSATSRRASEVLASDDVLRIRSALASYVDANGDYRPPAASA